MVSSSIYKKNPPFTPLKTLQQSPSLQIANKHNNYLLYNSASFSCRYYSRSVDFLLIHVKILTISLPTCALCARHLMEFFTPVFLSSNSMRLGRGNLFKIADFLSPSENQGHAVERRKKQMRVASGRL